MRSWAFLKKDILYIGTKEVAEVDSAGKTWVTFVDHLGSPRFIWDGTANPVKGTNLIEQKFMPFGESLANPTDAAKFAKGFTNHEQTDASGLIYMQARMYLPMYGKFNRPDPAMDVHPLKPQSWNLYSYVWNNPVMKTDPTGMEVVVDGDRSKDYITALQKNVSFKVELSDKGKVVATVGKDQKLSKMDKAILGAINDEKHTVNIHAISNDSNVFLGRSDGAHKGEHTIAFDQVNLLDQPKNAGGMTSAQLVGHETMEGYAESKGSSFERAHNEANNLFPGFSNRQDLGLLGKNGTVVGISFTLQIQGTNITEKFKALFPNPFPAADLGTPRQPPGQNAVPIDIEVVH